MEESNPKLFDLNIEKVLENWEVYHALREIIANALDEQLLTQTGEIEIFMDQQDQWHVRDFGRGLRYQHLTQNENEEKLAHPSLVIGKFGVGLKDALATLDRHKINVLIRSRNGDITIIKSEKHGFQDITTLHASISPPSDKDFRGTEFVFRGVTDNDMETAKGFFLKFTGEIPLEETLYGSILKKVGQSKIYINGLRVAEEENFLFSYNITSTTEAMRKALSREKTHIGRTAYTERVKAVLLACKTKEVAELLAKDLQSYETGLIHDELKWNDVAVHAAKLLNTAEKVILVTPSQLVQTKDMVDHAKSDGLKIVTIPENIKEKISGVKDYSGNVIRDLEGFRTEWNQSFEFKFVNQQELTHEERMVFDKTEELSNLIGGLPRGVKKIMISETMRAESSSYRDAAGLWEVSQGRIIIKRTQLRSLKDYAATLLHEMVHVESGTIDVSREFEDALTALLGLISSKALSQKNEKEKTSFLARFRTRTEKESNPKVKSVDNQPLQNSVSNSAQNPVTEKISNLVTNLSSQDRITRYKSIRELEKVFYGYSPSLPKENYHQVLLLMNRSSAELERCVEQIQRETGTLEDEKTRLLLLETLLMAKRTFLEFIVAEYIGNGSFRCKLCNGVFSRGGIRNHLSKSHPEKWKIVRPYTEEILQHLRTKGQSGLSSEEWERQLLQKFSAA